VRELKRARKFAEDLKAEGLLMDFKLSLCEQVEERHSVSVVCLCGDSVSCDHNVRRAIPLREAYRSYFMQRQQRSNSKEKMSQSGQLLLQVISHFGIN